MGYTGMHVEPRRNAVDVLREEFKIGDRIVDGVVSREGGHDPGESIVYLAVRDEDRPEVVRPFIVIVVRSREYFNFTYKEQTETMGPYARTCPPRILDKLTPIEELDYEGEMLKWASEWRQACREHAAKKAALPKVRPGDVVRFTEPLEFADGSTKQELRFQKGSTFGHPSWSSIRYRIPRWRERYDYTIVDGPLVIEEQR